MSGSLVHVTGRLAAAETNSHRSAVISYDLLSGVQAHASDWRCRREQSIGMSASGRLHFGVFDIRLQSNKLAITAAPAAVQTMLPIKHRRRILPYKKQRRGARC